MGDIISRNNAVKIIRATKVNLGDKKLIWRKQHNDTIDSVIDILNALPDYDIERQTQTHGSWDVIYDEEFNEDGVWVKCSNCETIYPQSATKKYYHCPNCGINMRSNL